MSQIVLGNSDVEAIEVFVPEGHKHVRTLLRLHTGQEFIFQEATVANLVRAYIDVKTHPQKEVCRLVRRELDDQERKEGYARWQLLEEP